MKRKTHNLGRLTFFEVLAMTGQLSLVVACASLVSCATVNIAGVEYASQRWTSQERHYWHHKGAGQAFAPLDWLQSLEQAGSQQMLMDPRLVAKFNLLGSPASSYNPAGLPVGFAVGAPGTRVAGQVGLTCAACHTGQLSYRGRVLRIDGASTHSDIPGFIGAYYEALHATVADSAKWSRFSARVARVSGIDDTALRAQVKRVIDEGNWAATASAPFANAEVVGGPGRMDPLDRIGNFVFGQRLLEKRNFHASDGVANSPYLWDVWRFDWVHYNASFSQPMARNVLQILGNGGLTNFVDEEGIPTKLPERWDTSIDFQALVELEAGYRKLRAPKWPAEIFGPYDRALALKGRALFAENCSGCHAPRPYAAPGNRQAQLAVTIVPLAKIGTDPAHAANFAKRVFDASKLTGDARPVTGSEGLVLVTEAIKSRGYDKLGWGPEQRAVADGFGRPNRVRGIEAYKARTLDGVWSTPPFLHNGSVPSIYELLSPVAERSKRFWTGRDEYDPIKLGYVSTEFPGGFLFDTSIPGNRNTGHEFNDGPRSAGVIGRWLSHEERMALIEYLKALPDMPPNRMAPRQLNWD